MTISLEQRVEVFNMLDAEAIKADKAVNKAQKDYENARRYPESTTYAMAKAMLELRIEQRALPRREPVNLIRVYPRLHPRLDPGII